MIVILTASTIGTEYGWGTLRSVLAGGMARWRLLAVKLLLLVALAATALATVTVITAGSSLLAGAIASDGQGIADVGDWGNVGISYGKSLFGLVPYVLLAGFVTVVASSSAGGMAVTLGYYFGELIAVAILINLFDWFQNVADYVLGRKRYGVDARNPARRGERRSGRRHRCRGVPGRPARLPGARGVYGRPWDALVLDFRPERRGPHGRVDATRPRSRPIGPARRRSPTTPDWPWHPRWLPLPGMRPTGSA